MQTHKLKNIWGEPSTSNNDGMVYLVSIIDRNVKCAICKEKMFLWLSRVLFMWTWGKIESATPF